MNDGGVVDGDPGKLVAEVLIECDAAGATLPRDCMLESIYGPRPFALFVVTSRAFLSQ